MKEVSIPGSKFILALEDEENQWFLCLRINNAVEEKLPLTHLEVKTLRNNIKELMQAAHLNLNDLQIDRIHDQIWSFIQEKLQKEREAKKQQFGTIEDPRYEELVDQIEQLQEKFTALEEKISKKEQLLT